MNILAFSFRMLRRDARAGELHLLVLALVVAVAALSAVAFFTDRVDRALAREANQLLGADLLLIADHPWSAAFPDGARQAGLSVVQTQSFPSMVSAGSGEGSRVQLAEIKAVEAGYPLRGRLRTAPELHAPDAPANGIPVAGIVWVEERLATALNLAVGDPIAVGQVALRVGAILTQEPDRGVNFFSVAPRLLMNLSDLGRTGLVGTGSRVSYRLLVAGEEKALTAFRAGLDSRLGRGERVEDVQNARPEIRSALERAQRFLGLSALLTVVLAAVAIALAARRYLQRHLDPCAVMRCLGATQGFLLAAFVGQFALLGVAGAALGVGLGYLAHFVLHGLLAQLLATPLPPPGILPAVQGALVGLLLLFGFALPPLLQLKSVSTLRVLRREFASGTLPPGRLLAGYALGFVALAGLMFWVAGEVRLGAYVVGGFSGALLVCALIARLAIRGLARLRGGATRGGIGWRYGLASLERHAAASVVQIVALTLGFMALLLLTATRTQLLEAWRGSIPPEAPNRFVLNVQPGQLESVRRHFAAAQVDARFEPMVRGRLNTVNGKPVGPEDFTDERAKRLVEREFNLSYRADLPSGNTVSAGRWFAAGDPAEEASVELGLAQTLGLQVGDRLEFNVAGEPVRMRVVGLRKLSWDSMRVNFFVITPPALLEDYPTSWISSFYLPPGQDDFVNGLVRAFPNLTVIDVAAIVRQLQAIMDQVATAVQFIFLFTLAAGLIVLYSALAAAADERRFELAVMRAVGARRDQLRRALLAEFATIGALAGIVAALGASAVGEVLAARAFQLEVGFAWWLLPAALTGGALLVAGAGWFAAARMIEAPPLAALRAG